MVALSPTCLSLSLSLAVLSLDVLTWKSTRAGFRVQGVGCEALFFEVF